MDRDYSEIRVNASNGAFVDMQMDDGRYAVGLMAVFYQYVAAGKPVKFPMAIEANESK